jgi:hypothetical protein
VQIGKESKPSLLCRRDFSLQAPRSRYRVPLGLERPNVPIRTVPSGCAAAARCRRSDRGIPESLETEHHSNAMLETPMVLLDLVVQVFRRAQLRIRGQRAIGFQLAHCTVRCRVAVQRDGPRAALLAFDCFIKVRLGSHDIAPGAQPEIDRPARPVNGTIQVAPLASDLDICLVDPPNCYRLTPFIQMLLRGEPSPLKGQKT